MLRTLVVCLVIAAPLFSQDLLVDSIEREFSGTLIKITDTYIHFQIQGETEAVQYPFWSVNRVTLADGRLAFEDGKTYVAKPTLTAEPKLAEPTPPVAKSMEPQPMEARPEVELPAPQPALVPEPAEMEAFAAGPPPVFTEVDLMTLAVKNAARNYNAVAWQIGGGLLGCGGMFLGGIVGASLVGFPGFVIGAGVGAVGASEMMAASVTEVPLPVELEAAAPDLQETYRQAYISQTRELRRYSIYSGVLGTAAFAGIGLLGIIITVF